MITVEIEVPVTGKKYDFRIDENVPLFQVKEEIVEMICQKEQCNLSGNPDRLMMWNGENRKQLEQEMSAQESGLLTGSRLLLL